MQIAVEELPSFLKTVDNRFIANYFYLLLKSASDWKFITAEDVATYVTTEVQKLITERESSDHRQLYTHVDVNFNTIDTVAGLAYVELKSSFVENEEILENGEVETYVTSYYLTHLEEIIFGNFASIMNHFTRLQISGFSKMRFDIHARKVYWAKEDVKFS